MTSSIRPIHEATGVSSDTQGGVAPDLVFHHPFLNAPLRGRDHFERFWSELSRLAGPVTFTDEFQGEDGSGLIWSAAFADQPVQGVSIAAFKEQRVVELRVIVRPLPSVQKLRDTMRERDRHLAGALWELPAGTNVTPPPFDPSAPVDAHLPFQVTPEVAFHTPVLQRPVVGEDLVKRIVGHATIIYGGRTYGSRMLAGPQSLTQWVGAVGGQPIHAANHSRRDEQGRVKAITMFMGPLPTLELFFRQLRPRVETFLDAEYFAP
jgi:hypothetical protein